MIEKRLEAIRKYLCALEMLSLHFTDLNELITSGLLDAEKLLPTAKAHAFIDNTHSKERWNKVIASASTLVEAVSLADQYAREDVSFE
ncbi:hypothetical protein ACFSTH_08355 [Paenibacillus yanchengensis]|uniref:Uncharacterized protein n=1 Tax=Paenibacillus yanchengensis TaxID=2035833 RepID=A0ABW4YL26_9BACL